MNSTNWELRRRARESLGNKIFQQKWLMGLAVSFVIMAILGTASSVSMGIGSIILTGPLTFGLFKSFLIANRAKEELNFNNTFDGFKNFNSTFLLGLMQTLFIALWSLLLIVPGIIKTFAYSMAYYIMSDHPEYTWKQCLEESQRIMKGNKWKLFCLDFSFIGWYIVGSLCLGIGMFWVYPYHYMARAEFYNELIGYTNPTEEPIPDDYI